ncbi:transmembrane protein 182-like isoform 2-T2 [Odontesthes bonariensis]|uniref:transmembrane protein 182-like isoform X2 n=1 Tax=Odontesthes bonariensis TaxID=219752 RepID=UPI003F586470
MSPADRLKVLLFLALFFGAAGFLFMVLSCGTEYWLLAAESCDGGGGQREVKSKIKRVNDVKIFHEGLFWRCSFVAASDDYSIWDIWISNQPLSKVCHAAFLFPFPVHEPVWGKAESSPSEPYEHPSAIVFRTFWSIFLATGVMAVVIGGFLVICAAPLTNHKLYKVGGALHICGGLCLLVVVVMYLMWVQVLDTLEQFVLHRQAYSCPSLHLSIQHGPSFLLAPVAVFFCLLAGLLFVLMGQSVQGMELDRTDKIPKPSTTEH